MTAEERIALLEEQLRVLLTERLKVLEEWVAKESHTSLKPPSRDGSV